MKMISDEKQIQHYAEDHAAIVNVLDSLREFAATMQPLRNPKIRISTCPG